MIRPKDSEYAPSFRGYVGLVPEADVLSVLEAQLQDVQRLAVATEATVTFAYAPGKWTIRELAGHVGDAERVFRFSAFRSAGHTNPLPGFDENTYVSRASFNEEPLADLVESFLLQRRANLLMLRALRGAVGPLRHGERTRRHGSRTGVDHGRTRPASSRNSPGTIRR